MDNPTDKPVSDTPEGPGTDKESSVGGLSDLAHEELDEKPESKPAAPSVPADMPAFGLEPEPESPRGPEWEPPPMTVTFWQKMAPKRGIRAIHLIVGGLLVAIAGASVAAVVVLRQPPQAEGSAPIATATTTAPGSTAQPAATSTPAATAPAPATSPSVDKGTDAGATRSAKTAKSRTRSRDNRRAAPVKEKSKESRDEPAEPPAEPAPARGDALTAADIKLGVKQNMSKVKGCIKSARKAGVLTPGRHTLILDWTIAPSGAVTKAHVRGPARVLNTSLAKCFSSAMRRWQFPPSPKGAPVKNFPFGPFNLK